jgi:hypothetical protein
MAQILRPSSDVSSNLWSPTPIWQEIDEASPDDDTSKVTASHLGTGSSNAQFRVGLSNPPGAPNPSGAYSFSYRINHVGFGNQGTLTLITRLKEGATTIAAQSVSVFVDDTYTEITRVLSGAEKALIVSENNLELEMEAQMAGGAPAEQVEIRVTQVYVSVPDVAAVVGAGSVSAPRLGATGSGTYTAPAMTGDGSVTVPAIDAAGSGAYVVPVEGDGVVSGVELDGAGTGLYLGVDPVQGDGSVGVPELDALGDGVYVELVTGSGSGELEIVQVSGAGKQTGVWVKDLPKPGTWT